jgi:SAM-dependent methyltransferase
VVPNLGKLLKREILILPRGSRPIVFNRTEGRRLLPLKYTYRARADGCVQYEIQLSGRALNYNLYVMSFGPGLRPERGELCSSYNILSPERGHKLEVSLLEPKAWINQKELDPISFRHHETRKFIAELELVNGSGTFGRLCAHYLPYENKDIGKEYYFGEDYVDYSNQTDTEFALRLVKRFAQAGRLLDVGCALGIYTRAFSHAGFDAYGVDISPFAIAEARQRIEPSRVRQCDLDSGDVPFEFEFDVVWMWDILEHSSDPQRLLAKITQRASSGAWLFLHTSNSDSLTHRIFGADWEGYSDYSHKGVEKVSAVTLRSWLGDLGWQIVEWECNLVWVVSADPTLINLQDAFHRIPELGVMLSERDLGDVLMVVAKRT